MVKRERRLAFVREAAAVYGELEVSATDFKTHCLGLIERIRRTGETVIVTRHGEPVARLEGYQEGEAAGVVDSLKGTVMFYEDPLEPTGEEWEVDGDEVGEAFPGA